MLCFLNLSLSRFVNRNVHACSVAQAESACGAPGAWRLVASVPGRGAGRSAGVGVGRARCPWGCCSGLMISPSVSYDTNRAQGGSKSKVYAPHNTPSSVCSCALAPVSNQVVLTQRLGQPVCMPRRHAGAWHGHTTTMCWRDAHDHATVPARCHRGDAMARTRVRYGVRSLNVTLILTAAHR